MADLPAILEGGGRGAVVNVNDLAKFIGLSAESIRNDVRIGCPIIRAGTSSAPTILNAYAWYRWKMDRKESEIGRHPQRATGDARQRAEEATAALRETRVAILRKEWVPIDSIQPLIEDSMASFRTRCAGLEDSLREICGPEVARQVAEKVGDFLNRATEQMCDEADRLTER